MRRLRHNQGQATVEMALTLPLLLLMVVGILIFGHVMFSRTVVMLAAHQGARLGAVLYGQQPVPADARRLVEEKVIAIMNASVRGIDRRVDVSTTADDVSVTVTYNYSVAVPWIANLFGDSKVPVTMMSTYRIEKQ